jgi:hypothetical protein
MELLNILHKNPLARSLTAIFVILFIFWIWIFSKGFEQGFYNNLFGALYPIISLAGGLYGLIVVSKEWGGLKSLVGKGVFFLSLGLLAEVFGQWAWSYFTIVKGIEVPYPSIADIGYFLIVPFYILAMYNLGKAAGIKFGLSSFRGKIQAIAIPVLMVAIAYILFLKDVVIDSSEIIRTFLDLGYPGFEAIAISIGILTYTLSRGFLGGAMRSRVLLIVIALVFQYITDYTFTYQVGTEIYYNGGIVDLMYMISLIVMSFAVISLRYPHSQTSQA